MKKSIILSIIAVAFVFTACQDDFEPGGTAMQEMAGDWWVTYQNSLEEYEYLFYNEGEMPSESTIDNWTWGYIYDDTYSRLTISNTALNTEDTLLITDNGAYWDFKVKAHADLATKTFEIGKTKNLAYDSEVKIIGGKILKNAATSPSGRPVDSLVFYIQFFDDSYGFTYTKVSGFRRTGFPADDF